MDETKQKYVVEEARVEKRKGRKQKKCTSDSGSSSKMRWVTDISSFCLDCKKERGTKDKVIYIYIYIYKGGQQG